MFIIYAAFGRVGMRLVHCITTLLSSFNCITTCNSIMIYRNNIPSLSLIGMESEYTSSVCQKHIYGFTYNCVFWLFSEIYNVSSHCLITEFDYKM